MNILFALIFVASHDSAYMASASTTAVRVGAYQKQSQCKQQGQMLVDAMQGREVRRAYFFCVPVNK